MHCYTCPLPAATIQWLLHTRLCLCLDIRKQREDLRTLCHRTYYSQYTTVTTKITEQVNVLYFRDTLRVALLTTGGQSPTTKNCHPHRTKNRLCALHWTNKCAWLSWPFSMVNCLFFFALLTFKPIWSGIRKVLLMWNHSFLLQSVRGCSGGGSIIWLYNYLSEQNALFVLIWSICDTDPYRAGTSSHPFLISELNDERILGTEIWVKKKSK